MFIYKIVTYTYSGSLTENVSISLIDFYVVMIKHLKHFPLLKGKKKNYLIL